jgi:hypothetical protein
MQSTGKYSRTTSQAPTCGRTRRSIIRTLHILFRLEVCAAKVNEKWVFSLDLFCCKVNGKRFSFPLQNKHVQSTGKYSRETSEAPTCARIIRSTFHVLFSRPGIFAAKVKREIGDSFRFVLRKLNGKMCVPLQRRVSCHPMDTSRPEPAHPIVWAQIILLHYLVTRYHLVLHQVLCSSP